MNREGEVSAWLRGLPVKASARHQVRIYVLRMLEHSGVHLKRRSSDGGTKVEAVPLSEIT
jgi:hypothetical protein